MKLLNILKDRYKKDYNIIQIYASNYVIGNYLKLGFHIKKDMVNANEIIDGITLLEAGFGNELDDNTKFSNEEIRNYGYGINNSFNNFKKYKGEIKSSEMNAISNEFDNENNKEYNINDGLIIIIFLSRKMHKINT